MSNKVKSSTEIQAVKEPELTTCSQCGISKDLLEAVTSQIIQQKLNLDGAIELVDGLVVRTKKEFKRFQRLYNELHASAHKTDPGSSNKTRPVSVTLQISSVKPIVLRLVKKEMKELYGYDEVMGTSKEVRTAICIQLI